MTCASQPPTIPGARPSPNFALLHPPLPTHRVGVVVLGVDAAVLDDELKGKVHEAAWGGQGG